MFNLVILSSAQIVDIEYKLCGAFFVGIVFTSVAIFCARY